MTKNILASSLLDWTRNSETTFITAEMDAELVAKAEKLGIVLPSSDLAIFKTIYAEIDKVNRNGVVLPRKAVEAGLPTIRGKQINWEHQGAGRICGYILDAEIVDDKIVVYGTLFKSLFVEEFDKVEELFTEKKLFVSFEIWNRDEKGDSVLHILSNGDRAIDPIIFHGCGLLLENPPACPNARVLQLIASQKVVDEAELIVKEIMEKDENLVYAELAIEEPKCKGCNPCTCNKDKGGETTKMAENIEVLELDEEVMVSYEQDYEGEEIEEAKKLKYEDRKNLPDSDFAVVVTVKNKTTGEPRKIRMFPIHDEAHVRNALARLPQAAETLKKLGISQDEVKNKILKRAKELNMTELVKRHEKAEDILPTEIKTIETEIKEEAKLVTCPNCGMEFDDKEGTDGICAKCSKQKKEKAEEVISVPEIKPEEAAKIETTPEEVTTPVETTPKEEEVAAIATPEEVIVAQPEVQEVQAPVTIERTEEVHSVVETKEGEQVVTTDVKSEVVVTEEDGTKEVHTTEEHRVETYTKAEVDTMIAEQAKLVEEKDKEIEKLKAELAAKPEIKIETAETTEVVELEVGTVEPKKENRYKAVRNEIDKRAFSAK